MDISSFERLITIYKSDIGLFDQVLSEKRENSLGKNKDGYEYDQILSKYHIYENKNDFLGRDHWATYILKN